MVGFDVVLVGKFSLFLGGGVKGYSFGAFGGGLASCVVCLLFRFMCLGVGKAFCLFGFVRVFRSLVVSICSCVCACVSFLFMVVLYLFRSDVGFVCICVNFGN